MGVFLQVILIRQDAELDTYIVPGEGSVQVRGSKFITLTISMSLGSGLDAPGTQR